MTKKLVKRSANKRPAVADYVFSEARFPSILVRRRLRKNAASNERGRMLIHSKLASFAAGATPKLRRRISAVLASPEAMSKLMDEVAGRWADRIRVAADGETPIIDFIKWLLDWLLNHADELLKIVTSWIAIFVV